MAEVAVNGELRTVSDGASVSDLLDALDVSREGLAVEVNRAIVPRAAHASTVLQNGDEIEIVTFVGGG
ncbi:MAG: sulfur carrier protein ThiS [Planctomycetota bacterium]